MAKPKGPIPEYVQNIKKSVSYFVGLSGLCNLLRARVGMVLEEVLGEGGKPCLCSAVGDVVKFEHLRDRSRRP